MIAFDIPGVASVKVILHTTVRVRDTKYQSRALATGQMSRQRGHVGT